MGLLEELLPCSIRAGFRSVPRSPSNPHARREERVLSRSNGTKLPPRDFCTLAELNSKRNSQTTEKFPTWNDDEERNHQTATVWGCDLNVEPGGCNLSPARLTAWLTSQFRQRSLGCSPRLT